MSRFRTLARRGRRALHRAFPAFAPAGVVPLPGGFQPYTHTLPNRYPWLFEFAREQLDRSPGLRLLSFGCSRGDEVFALRSYFPTARITGIDVNPENIALCQQRARAEPSQGINFVVGATTAGEQTASYDAIFCLAVLCHGDLTTKSVQRSDSLITFERFERVVTDFARCLKPGGLLLLHTTNFRFSDTQVSGEFTPVLDADPKHMATDVLFDSNNQLLQGARYYTVGFRRVRPSAAPTSRP
ncbi:MAG TPA: class I SAM-dependent methyltransferase [Steroidobacteraceae bacterium]